VPLRETSNRYVNELREPQLERFKTFKYLKKSMKKELIVLWLLLFLPVLSFAQDDEPLSLTATASQTSPFVGQTFVVSVSVINTAYEDISGFLLAKGASGITVYSIEAASGTSNQWSSGEMVFPGKGGHEEIKFNAVGNEAIEAPIEIMFSYKYQGKEKQITTSLNLTVKQPICGDGKCEHTETSENCCEDCTCLEGYKCEKKGSDIKPRCYQSGVLEFFGNILVVFLVWAFVIFVIVLVIFLIKKIFWHKH